MTVTAPYGTWPSPITPAMLAGTSRAFWGLAADGNDVYWGEYRPGEGGRVATMRLRNGEVAELAPGFSGRTLVHEYGGQSLAADGTRVVATRFEDQRIHRLDGVEPRPITPEPPAARAWRYADATIVGDRVIAVREDHTGPGEARNDLVMVPIDGGAEPIVLAEGHDFYAAPAVDPTGTKVAWIAWNHPNMPWDHTEVWVGDLGDDGVDRVRSIPTSGESFTQPTWSPTGELHVVSDRSGWWNLYRVSADGLDPVRPDESEYGVPAWFFGFRTYGFLPDGRIAAVAIRDGRARLEIIDGATAHTVDLGGREAFGDWLTVAGGTVYATFGGPDSPMSLLGIDPDGEVRVVRAASDEVVPEGFVSHPEPIAYPTSDGETAHAFFYPPAHATHTGPAGDLPPLIVFTHGGPTSQTTPLLRMSILFWTTRGFAVADVNYRGSTGYGTAYRNALRGRWGEADVEDACRAADWLAERGRVDPDRLAIRGGSAGGYVTLCAMTFHDTFHAGTSYCGVADIQALMSTTHKFESRYDDTLLGPMPESAQLAHDRSPIHFADRVSCPALIIQGSEDTVVTPDQAEVFVDALRANGLPHAYLLVEGEDHFLSKADTVVRTAQAELSFYGQVFGFEPAGEIARLAIENL